MNGYMALWSDKSYNGVMYRDVAENEGGPIFQLADDASRVERPIRIQYTDVPNLARAFIGYSYVQSGSILRVIPHNFGGFEKLDAFGAPVPSSFLWCTATQRMDGLAVLTADSETGVPIGAEARARLLYTSPTYEVLPDDSPLMIFAPEVGQTNPGTTPDEATLARYVTRTYQPFTRAITIPRALMRWSLEAGDANYGSGDTPGPPIMESTGKRENGIVLNYRHHLRPEIPWQSIFNAMGCVNEFAFDGVFPAQTLLCEAPDIVMRTSGAGQRCFDITFRFRFLPKVDKAGASRGHNYFLRHFVHDDAGKSLDYRLLTTTGLPGGDRTYPSYDFASLFRPEV